MPRACATTHMLEGASIDLELLRSTTCPVHTPYPVQILKGTKIQPSECAGKLTGELRAVTLADLPP